MTHNLIFTGIVILTVISGGYLLVNSVKLFRELFDEL